MQDYVVSQTSGIVHFYCVVLVWERHFFMGQNKEVHIVQKKAFIDVKVELRYYQGNILMSGELTPQGVYDSDPEWIIE